MALVIKSKRDENKITFFLEGELDLHSSKVFKESVEKEYNNEPSDVELDFSKIEFIDSTCLGMLVSISKNMSETHNLCVKNLKPHIKKVFTITGLDKLFICKGEENA